MAVTTTDYYLTGAEGWVSVATDPSYCKIRPDRAHLQRTDVFFAISAAPLGAQRGSEIIESVTIDRAVSGGVYIRLWKTTGPLDRRRVSVIVEESAAPPVGWQTSGAASSWQTSGGLDSWQLAA